jgi:MoxR-like ATPase
MTESESPTTSESLTTTVADLQEAVTSEARKAIQGQQEVLELMLVSLLSRGHVLLEGVPGIAKTLLAKTLATIVGADFKRIQFTPDLMPSDITGTNVFDVSASRFELRRGPVFTHILLADEINRTPPKTQAALLQAMEERFVTIDGADHLLTDPFFVVATQNPIEYEGTYPLPEAQLDRFLMKVLVHYPSDQEEMAVLRQAHQGFDSHDLEAAGVRAVVTPAALSGCVAAIERVHVHDAVLDYILRVVRGSRQAHGVVLGGSPRAELALLRCGKTLAALRGRDYVIPDDIKELALPVLRHRLLLRPEAELEGLSPDRVVENLLAATPVPR